MYAYPRTGLELAWYNKYTSLVLSVVLTWNPYVALYSFIFVQAYAQKGAGSPFRLMVPLGVSSQYLFHMRERKVPMRVSVSSA